MLVVVRCWVGERVVGGEGDLALVSREVPLLSVVVAKWNFGALSSAVRSLSLDSSEAT